MNVRLGDGPTVYGFSGSTEGSTAGGGQLSPVSGLSGLSLGEQRRASGAVGTGGFSLSAFGGSGSLNAPRGGSGGVVGSGRMTGGR